MADVEGRISYQPTPQTVAQGYETSTLSVKGIVLFIIGLVVCGALIFWLVWVLLGGFLKGARSLQSPRSALDDVPPTVTQPPLQPSPTHNVLPFEDLKKMREHEDGVFADMGWQVNPNTGAPTIPDAVWKAVAAREKARKAATQP